jgi:hypothetical protein
MLNQKDWKEFEQLVDGEYMTQVDDSGFASALDGVKLAIAVIRKNEKLQEQAIAYLAKYGNWQDIPLPKEIKRELYIRNYGEEEVVAMEELGEINY